MFSLRKNQPSPIRWTDIIIVSYNAPLHSPESDCAIQVFCTAFITLIAFLYNCTNFQKLLKTSIH
nr:MAG TPA: hypothetical protein [Caudoviricetes sp.]